jgi:hypothetical protein
MWSLQLTEAQVTDSHSKCVSGDSYQHASTENAHGSGRTLFTQSGQAFKGIVFVMDWRNV